MKTLVLCVFAFLAFVPFALGAEVASLTGLPNQPFLYIEGIAETKKAPDIITMGFSIEARNPDQAKANQEVQAKAKKVFALLKETGVEDRDVVAQDLSSDAEYERDESDTKSAVSLSVMSLLDGSTYQFEM